MIRQTLTIIVLCTIALPSALVYGQGQTDSATSPNQESDNFIPADLDDAISHLKKTLPTSDIEFLKTASESDLARLHFSFGMGLRNDWGLWGGSRLANWFNDLGITHPDDMSGIIIESLIRDLRGEERDLEGQIAKYKAYWAEAAEHAKQEEIEDIRREERRRRDKLGWQWRESQAKNVTLPQQPEWKDVWGLAPYGGGFIVVIKRYRKEFLDVWHDGIYYLADPSSELRKVSISGCGAIHDVIVKNGVATWLCRSLDNQWSLIDTAPGRQYTVRTVDLPMDHMWLRIGTSDRGFLLVGPDRVYQDGGENWDVIFASESLYREFPRFDVDLIGEDKKEFFLPHRSATPFEHGGYLYFQVEDTGNETDLYRLEFGKGDADLEDVREFFVDQYIGRWGFHVSDAGIDESGDLWIAGHTLGTLFQIKQNGEMHIASVKHNLDFDGSMDDLRSPSNWHDRLPVGAILHEDGAMYLAGTDGIARVTSGSVEPIIRFEYPKGMSREPYVSFPQYEYHVKPQRLGRFSDGSFVIGDRFDGLYVLVWNDNEFTFQIPDVLQSTHEM